VKGIVEAHGGRVVAENAKPGLRVVVWLKDRKFNDPKVSITTPFASCQTRTTRKFTWKSHSPRGNHHLKAQGRPNSAGLELSATSRPAARLKLCRFRPYQATRWSNS
jgi:hypothetical protein